MTTKRILITCFIILANSIFLSGCASVDSAHIKPQGMSLYAEAKDSGSGVVELSASLKVGTSAWSNTFVRLATGESIVADLGDEKITLRGFEGLFGDYRYSAKLPIDKNSQARKISFTILRSKGKNTYSEVVIPAAFDIQSPKNNQVIDARFTNDITLSWKNHHSPKRPLNIRYSIECGINSSSATNKEIKESLRTGDSFIISPKDTSYTIALFDIKDKLRKSTKNKYEQVDCDLELIMSREESNDRVIGLAHAHISGVQTRAARTPIKNLRLY